MNLALNKNIPLLMLALLFLAACGGNKKETDTESSETDTISAVKDSSAQAALEVAFTPDQYKLAGIETGTIEKRNLSNVIKLNGVIDVEPGSEAIVSAPLGGYLKTAGLLPGQAISKGQVLATIENPEFINMQQDYLESTGRLKFLEQEYNRQQKLREEEVNATKTFQEVESNYRVMQARINGLEQKLASAGIGTSALKKGKITRTANLYAPISGYIKSSNVSIGKYASPTDVLFEIINKNDIHLALNALEKDLGKIQAGQTVKFSSANENKFNRTAKIFLVGKAAGEDKNIAVHCHIEKQDQSGLVPGMYVKAWIESGYEKQYAAPSESIVQLEGKDYLIIQTAQSQKEYTFLLEEIKKGTEQEGYTAITLAQNSKVSSGKVVVKNAFAILAALRNSEEE